MRRFKAVFASLLLFAAATSFIAGWGLMASSTAPSASFGGAENVAATQTASTTTGHATAQSSTESSVTASSPAGNATTFTTTAVTTTTVAGAAVTVTTTVAGGATTVTAAATTTAMSEGPGYGFAGGLSAASQNATALEVAQYASFFLAPLSWFLLGAAWIWRGRTRSRWTQMGFESDVFELFMKMKGGATRIKVLNTLTTPKDRLQLAEELGVDWKTVDRHVQVLNRYGFVSEQAAYGNVRLYEVTPLGKILLNLFNDLEGTGGKAGEQTSPESSPQESGQSASRPDRTGGQPSA